MATDAWTRTFPNSDDGEFRSWGSDLSSRLAGVGLVQTSDTGQINWGSVSRPSEDNYGGYEVWRFDDALQGTAPVFIKIEYGTANMSGSQVAPQLRFTVGNETDGAGTITHDGEAPTTMVSPTSVTAVSWASTTPLLSLLCYKDGFLGLILAIGGMGGGSPDPSRGICSMAISRTADADGTENGDGVLCCWQSTSNGVNLGNARSFIFDGQSSEYAQWPTVTPINITDTVDANNIVRAYPCFAWVPPLKPVIGLCGVDRSELPPWITFECAVVGDTPRTYMAIGGGLSNLLHGPANVNTYGGAMLWE